jgi:hypothetical protein
VPPLPFTALGPVQVPVPLEPAPVQVEGAEAPVLVEGEGERRPQGLVEAFAVAFSPELAL